MELVKTGHQVDLQIGRITKDHLRNIGTFLHMMSHMTCINAITALMYVHMGPRAPAHRP